MNFLPTSFYADIQDRMEDLESMDMASVSGQVTTLTNALATKASTSYVDGRFSDILNASPTALDTLKELADALGDDPNFATTVATSLGSKASISTTNALALRATATEGSITSLNTWRAAKAAYLGADVAGNLTTNYNVVTTLLGAVVGAMNTTNAKVNALAEKIIAIQSVLQTREMTLAA